MNRIIKLNRVVLAFAMIMLVSACNLNTSSENVISAQQEADVPDEIKDSPLEVSDIYGVDIIMLGTLEKFFVDISDADGIASVKFELQDKTGKVIKTFPFIKDGETHKIEMQTDGISAGRYQMIVTVIGIDGGVGDNSGKKVSTLALEVADKVTTNAAERF